MDVIEYPEAKDERQRLMVLMAEYLASVEGYTNVKLDFPGMDQPNEIQGRQRNHMPAITAVSSLGKLIYMDVVLVDGATVDVAEICSRLQLFYSASMMTEGELHVVLRSDYDGISGEKLIRRIGDKAGFYLNRVWTVEKV